MVIAIMMIALDLSLWAFGAFGALWSQGRYLIMPGSMFLFTVVTRHWRVTTVDNQAWLGPKSKLSISFLVLIILKHIKFATFWQKISLISLVVQKLEQFEVDKFVTFKFAKLKKFNFWQYTLNSKLS